MIDLVTILKTAVASGASDIHICVGKPPMMRLNGDMIPVSPAMTPLTGEETKSLVFSALHEEQRVKFEAAVADLKACGVDTNALVSTVFLSDVNIK